MSVYVYGSELQMAKKGKSTPEEEEVRQLQLVEVISSWGYLVYTVFLLHC